MALIQQDLEQLRLAVVVAGELLLTDKTVVLVAEVVPEQVAAPAQLDKEIMVAPAALTRVTVVAEQAALERHKLDTLVALVVSAYKVQLLELQPTMLVVAVVDLHTAEQALAEQVAAEMEHTTMAMAETLFQEIQDLLIQVEVEAALKEQEDQQVAQA